jgi:carboxymethylenebutenolidase
MRRWLLLTVVACGCFAPRFPPADPGEREIDGGDGLRGKMYLPKKSPSPAVVVLHGDHGPTPRIDEHARRLRDAGYVVLAVDLYRGEKVDNLLDAHIMDRGLPEDRVKSDLRAAVDLLSSEKEVNKDAIGIIGWDMGGGYALDAARADPRLKAVVTCYGRLTTDPALLKSMDAAVLALMAGKDEGNGPETREAFRDAMKTAGKRLTLHVFDGCDHGFMNPPPKVELNTAEVKANEDAWQRITQFLTAELGAK